MKVPIDTLDLNIVDTGSGNPTLVFLHYWGGSSRTWSSVTRALEPSFRSIAYDQRGWGSSDAPANAYSLQNLADDASMLISTLGLRRYVLVGHSMGGKVAQLLASQRPSGLEALILVAPASPFPQHIPEEAKQAQLHAYDNRATAIAAIDFLTVRRPAAALLEQLVQDSLGGSPGAKRAWPTSTAYEDISAQVSNIAVPTLILVGDQDRQDPVELQRREILPSIPGAEMKVILDCGHLIPVDQPAALAEEIAMFLANMTK